MRGMALNDSLLAASEALEGRIVHVGSLLGGCVLQVVVSMVVTAVLEKTLVVRVRIEVDVQ